MKNIMVILSLLFSSILTLSAQTSLIEQLGGVRLNLKITSGDDIILNDSEQYIVRRAVHNRNYEPVLSYASAYGYHPLHLEFLAKAKVEKGNTKRSKYDYRIRFYGANDQLLLSRDYGRIRYLSLEDETNGYKYVCSFGLLGLPLPFIQELTRIDITRI